MKVFFLFVLIEWFLMDVFFTYRYKKCRRLKETHKRDCQNWLCKKYHECTYWEVGGL